MLEGTLFVAAFQKAERQAVPCAHIGPRFEEAPEVPVQLFEARRPANGRLRTGFTVAVEPDVSAFNFTLQKPR